MDRAYDFGEALGVRYGFEDRESFRVHVNDPARVVRRIDVYADRVIQLARHLVDEKLAIRAGMRCAAAMCCSPVARAPETQRIHTAIGEGVDCGLKR